MKPVDFDTLEQAQSYTETTTKMLSGDQMRIYMVLTGLYSYFKNHTSDAQSAAYDNMFGGEFNFIDGHPSNVSGLFQLMIDEEETPDVDTQLTTLLGYCQAYANQTSQPFAGLTQEEFDASKAEQALYVATHSTKTSYGQLDSNVTHHIQSSSRKLRVTVILDEAPTVETTSVVSTLVDLTNESTATFVDEIDSIVLTKLKFGIGQTSRSQIITAPTGLTRRSRMYSVLDTSIPHTVLIQAV